MTQNSAVTQNTQFPTANKIKNPLQQPFIALKNLGNESKQKSAQNVALTINFTILFNEYCKSMRHSLTTLG